MRFTNIDTKFERKIDSIFDDISDSDDIVSNSSVKQDVLDVINDFFLPFGTPWMFVDIVLNPIWLPEQKHWLLAILNFVNENSVFVVLCLFKEVILLSRMHFFHCLRYSHIIWTWLVFTRGLMLISLPSVRYTVKGRTNCIRSIMARWYPRTTPKWVFNDQLIHFFNLFY